MSIANLLLEDFDAEMSGVRKTLERIPEQNPEFVPHDKSMAMGRLAMHVASLPLFGSYILTEPGLDLARNSLAKTDLTFTTREHLLATFDSAVHTARTALAQAPDEALSQLWRFSFGEHVISNQTRSRTWRIMFFNHLIHHRAQLGIYLRLNNVAVPGLYGPSADEPF